jgi:hypothetical protein
MSVTEKSATNVQGISEPKASSNSESSKIILSIVYALIISVLVLILITNDMVSIPLIVPMIPAVAYAVSIGLSSIYQYSICNKVSIGQIAISNIFIVLTTLIATTILYVEQMPILKFMFGEYVPSAGDAARLEGAEGEGGECCNKNGLKDSEAHYKIQFFTNIVKAVLPKFISEENSKLGFVYFYWIFWMTILPFFFLLSVQGLCK